MRERVCCEIQDNFLKTFQQYKETNNINKKRIRRRCYHAEMAQARSALNLVFIEYVMILCVCTVFVFSSLSAEVYFVL